jgi:hypothetical protein
VRGDELHDSYCSPECVGHVARTDFCGNNVKEREPVDGLGLYNRMVKNAS